MTDETVQLQNVSTVSEINPALSLLGHLKKVPGLYIDQRGSDINVFLRGVSTISAENSALFVVNGTPVGTRYSDLENSVDVNDVENISIMRGSQASQIYGFRGAYGAVIVSTK